MSTNGDGGTLDLSQVESAPYKVKLPDGNLYDMANPERMGPLSLQRFISRHRRAQQILGDHQASEQDVEEMLSLLVDCAQVVVPDAPREVVGELEFGKLERLIEAFSSASPVAKAKAGEAATSAN